MRFRIAGGSVPGTEHIGSINSILGKANQDAFGWIEEESEGFKQILALVCDGSSSGDNSEVGASIGLQVLLSLFQQEIRKAQITTAAQMNRVLETVTEDFCKRLRIILGTFVRDGLSREEVIRSYFLFTIVGVFVGHDKTFVFALGDGVFCVNGTIRTLGPFVGNAPPYIAYNLLPAVASKFTNGVDLTVEEEIDTSLLEDLLIGTDGCNDLLKTKQLSKSFQPLFADQSYFDNPAKVGRMLRQLNNVQLSFSAQPQGTNFTLERQTTEGALPDDTTMILIRRERTPQIVVPSAAINVGVKKKSVRDVPPPKVAGFLQKGFSIFGTKGVESDDSFID
jgi:hypothetical protein